MNKDNAAPEIARNVAASRPSRFAALVRRKAGANLIQLTQSLDSPKSPASLELLSPSGQVVHSHKMAVDLEVVRHALTVARQRNYASVELETPEVTFSADLARGHALPTPTPVEEAATLADAAELRIVRSSLVGYFRSGPREILVGDHVELDDVIGLVTVLGIPNDIVAGVSGVVAEVLVKDGDPVEYGQALMMVNPE